MKKCSKCGAEKPLTDFYKQKAAKDGYYSQCKLCANASQKKSKAGQGEGYLEKKRAWQAAYAEKNREAVNARQREFYKGLMQSRPELVRTWSREAVKRWRNANPTKVSEQTMRRKAAKLRAVPRWADPVKIQGFYDARKLLGDAWHVDHIVPLTSPLVCGLHCEANLRLIPASENLSKRNRHWPDMP